MIESADWGRVARNGARVNLQKIAKRVKKEAYNSPGKAAVLGIVCIMAIYFWLPLVSKWVFGSAESIMSDAPAVATQSAEGQNGAATNASIASISQPQNSLGLATANTTQQRPWFEVMKMIESDPNMSPVLFEAEVSPFAVASTEPEKVPSAPESVVRPPAEKVTPAALGITVVGTLVGPNRRAARLGGKTVLVGQSIEVVKGAERYLFTLAEVHPNRVVLVRDGERFELSVKPSNSSGAIEITSKP